MCTVTVPLAVIFSNILLLQTVRMWGLVMLSFLAKTRLRRSNEKCLENHIKSPKPPKMRPPNFFLIFRDMSLQFPLAKSSCYVKNVFWLGSVSCPKPFGVEKPCPHLGPRFPKQMMRQDFSVSSNLQSTKGYQLWFGMLVLMEHQIQSLDSSLPSHNWILDFRYLCGFSLKGTFIQAAYLASVESWIGEFWFSSSWLVHKAEEKPSLSVWLPTFITNFQPEEAEGATGAIAGVAPKAHIHTDC